MGKFEKLVVLTVVFTAAIVLAISFYRGESKADDPLSGAREVLGAERSFPEQASLDRGTPEPSFLLDAGLETPTETPAVEPEPEPVVAGLRPALQPEETGLTMDPSIDVDHRILLETNGLRPSFLDEYRMYTVVEGDTWTGLAQRFYQDGRYTRNLHIANEDLDELAPGKDILVPVFDLLAAEPAASRPSSAPVSEETPVAAAPAFVTNPAARSAAPASAPARTPATTAAQYEVRSGDTLSEISLAVFGTSTRWKEILEANSDQLQKPESLRVGMKLKIPAGGKVPPAGAEKKATKPAPKSSAPAKTSAAAPKKHKVD